MKKMMIMMCLVVAAGFMASNALAETKLFPENVVVSATCNLPNKTATINVSNMPSAKVDYYGYGNKNNKPDIKDIPAEIKLNQGRRFNVIDSVDGLWALLTDDMAASPPDLFGKGVGLDCSNPAGCAFVITCE